MRLLGLIPILMALVLGRANVNSAMADGLQETKFTLDNVAITVVTPFLPMLDPTTPTDNPFVLSEPGNRIQVATANGYQPFQPL
jgi:hypothetical protein